MTALSERSSASSNPVLWAIYLGMSWTWVIGMFLPVLLVRDYGIWGWVIFAIPNCIGAAAMGWVMRSWEQSVMFVHRHAHACRIFSLVTIAFHLFVACWIAPKLVGNAGWIIPIVLTQLAFTPMLRGRGQLTASVLTFAISVILAIGLFNNQGLSIPPSKPFSPGEMAGLAIVCLLGFGLCPYLDLTFHTARQHTTDGGAKIAFGVGFCLFFASMIVLTLGYSMVMANLMPQGVVGNLIVGQIAIQSALTVTLHGRALHDQAVSRDGTADLRGLLGVALGTGLCGGMIAWYADSWQMSYAGLSIGEVIYRCFMSFYGLIAPAYLVVSILSGKPRWMATMIVTFFAAGFYWMGFVERQMMWAGIGGAVVLTGCVIFGFAGAANRRDAAAPVGCEMIQRDDCVDIR